MLAVSWSTKHGLLGGGKEGEGTATKMIRLWARPEAWTSYMSSRQYLRSCRRDLVERRSVPIWEQEIPDSANGRMQFAIGNAGRSDQCDRRAVVCAREPRTKILSIVTAESNPVATSAANLRPRFFTSFTYCRHIRSVHDRISWSL